MRERFRIILKWKADSKEEDGRRKTDEGSRRRKKEEGRMKKEGRREKEEEGSIMRKKGEKKRRRHTLGAEADLGTVSQKLSPAANARGSDPKTCTGVLAHRAWEVLSRGRRTSTCGEKRPNPGASPALRSIRSERLRIILKWATDLQEKGRPKQELEEGSIEKERVGKTAKSKRRRSW